MDNRDQYEKQRRVLLGLITLCVGVIVIGSIHNFFMLNPKAIVLLGSPEIIIDEHDHIADSGQPEGGGEETEPHTDI